MLLFELEYKGKKYFLHFSHYAISRTELSRCESLAESLKSVDGQEELFYHAMVAGCEQKNLKPASREAVPFMIDANMARIEWMLWKSLSAIEAEKKRLGMPIKKKKS